jgi:hypothetical protein
MVESSRDETRVRKWLTQIEQIDREMGRPLPRPLRKVVVAAVVTNPYAGQWADDLSELVDLGGWLSEQLGHRAREALGEEIEGYGKGGIVGEDGEIEHVAAVLHPKFGAPIRAIAGGVSILPSVKKRSVAGAALDIPVHHKTAMLVRSHFDGVELRCPDAPHADELLVALAVTNGGRPFARVGGLRPDEVRGEDGLR